ncbi:MAG: adenylate/guanylate cyclase domain-containing protein [Flammeovirgaceae bacterium]
MGVIWFLMYYFIFGIGITALLPLSFTVIVGTSIIISHKLQNHLPTLYAQLTCITWITAFIQWSIGSIDDSGAVVVWSFLGPLGALIFLDLKKSYVWMAMFLGITIFSAFLKQPLIDHPKTVSASAQVLFYVMNIGFSSVVVFGTSAWFAHTIQLEKGKSESLLEKIQTLFGQHVSSEVADRLLSKDLDKAESNSYNATVLFLDIRDFTLFANVHSATEVVAFQNIIFGELMNIVREYGGTVNQLLGDGMLAIFGAPIVNDTHVKDAIAAGFAMIERVEQLGNEGKIHPVKIGIGVHTGQIIAGEVGNEYRKLYSITGSDVIVASRIEQLNKKYDSQFLVSQAVCEHMNHEYDCIKHGRVELKGILEPMDVYQLK